MRVYLAGAALLLAASGCGVLHGGGEERQEVPREQLAIMVVPQDELGARYGALEADTDSGRVSAAEFAEDTLDPDDTAASVRRDGWRSGYSLQYSNPKGFDTKKHLGLLYVTTEVHAFESPSSARADIVRSMQDFARYRGETVEGVKIGRSTTFEADVGDEGWGIEAAASVAGLRFHGTLVAFRAGPVEAVATIFRDDTVGERLETIRVAKLLASRVAAGLDGQLTGEPAPIASKKPKISRARIEAMTLSAADIAAGAKLTKERLDRSQDDYIELVREFALPGRRLGTSRVVSARVATEVYSDARGAKLFKQLLAGKEGKEFFVDSFASGIDKKRFKDLQVHSRPLELGDRRMTAFLITLTAPAGRADMILVVVARNRTVALVGILGPSGDVRGDDARGLAAKAWAKLG